MPPSTAYASVWDWMPDLATVLIDLKSTVGGLDEDDVRIFMTHFQGIDMRADSEKWFDGFTWVQVITGKLHFSGGTTPRCFCTAGIRMQTVSQLVFGLPR